MSKVDGLLGFSIGLGVGAGVALLLAPNSGARTQALIRRKIRKGQKYFQDQTAGLRDSAAGLFEQGKEQVARHRVGLDQALDAGARAYKKSIA
jgi:gas vesicle protein